MARGYKQAWKRVRIWIERALQLVRSTWLSRPTDRERDGDRNSNRSRRREAHAVACSQRSGSRGGTYTTAPQSEAANVTARVPDHDYEQWYADSSSALQWHDDLPDDWDVAPDDPPHETVDIVDEILENGVVFRMVDSKTQYLYLGDKDDPVALEDVR